MHCQMKNNDPRIFPYRIAVVVCVAAYFISFYELRPSAGPLAFLLSAIAGTFYFGIFISLGLMVLRKFDEFQRVLLARSFIWATVVTMGLATIWGFVELGSHNTVPRFPVVFLPIILICVTAAAKLLIFRQHRPADE